MTLGAHNIQVTLAKGNTVRVEAECFWKHVGDLSCSLELSQQMALEWIQQHVLVELRFAGKYKRQALEAPFWCLHQASRAVAPCKHEEDPLLE